MRTITPTRDLKFEDGTTSFTKGREYKTWYDEITERTQVEENNQGVQHCLGKWAKYFKFVNTPEAFQRDELKKALQGLVAYVEAYHNTVDASGYLDAAYEALRKAK